MSEVTHAQAREFEELLSADTPMVVDFYADWCMPCKMMAPVMEKLAGAYDGRVRVIKVNVDEEPDLAAQYGIQSIPAILFFQNGEQTNALLGVRPYDELTAELDRLL